MKLYVMNIFYVWIPCLCKNSYCVSPFHTKRTDLTTLQTKPNDIIDCAYNNFISFSTSFNFAFYFRQNSPFLSKNKQNNKNKGH